MTNSTRSNLSTSENESFLIKNLEDIRIITSADWRRSILVNQEMNSETNSKMRAEQVLEFKFVFGDRYFTVGSIPTTSYHKNNIIRCY